MKPFGRDITIASNPERPLPKSDIYWCSQAGGNTCFPASMDSIIERVHSESPTPMREFGLAVRNAVDRVWIVDEYLLAPDKNRDPESRIHVILEWIHLDIVASDIRILTKPHAEIGSDILDLFRFRETDINRRSARRDIRFSIQIRMHLRNRFDFIHDRFAIVDEELWHFGGTVGGFHAKISAASRGWRALDHGAIDFFQMAWEAGD